MLTDEQLFALEEKVSHLIHNPCVLSDDQLLDLFLYFSTKEEKNESRGTSDPNTP